MSLRRRDGGRSEEPSVEIVGGLHMHSSILSFCLKLPEIPRTCLPYGGITVAHYGGYLEGSWADIEAVIDIIW